MDLEWNIGVKPTDKGYFDEIIEIGAVKLDESLNIVDKFTSLVRPTVNKTLNRKVKSMTHIPIDELREAKKFRTVYDEFMRWCGNDENIFVTWSSSDIVVMLNNLKFYRMPIEIKKMSGYCDIQPYVQKKLEFDGTQMALSTAADKLGISCEFAEFHRALDDSIVTAECFKATFNGGLDEYIKTADTEFYERTLFKNKAITNLDSDLFGRADLMVKCPHCGRYLKRTEDFRRRNKSFVSYYKCNPCGKKFRGRLRIRLEYDGLKITSELTEQ